MARHVDFQTEAQLAYNQFRDGQETLHNIGKEMNKLDADGYLKMETKNRMKDALKSSSLYLLREEHQIKLQLDAAKKAAITVEQEFTDLMAQEREREEEDESMDEAEEEEEEEGHESKKAIIKRIVKIIEKPNVKSPEEVFNEILDSMKTENAEHYELDNNYKVLTAILNSRIKQNGKNSVHTEDGDDDVQEDRRAFTVPIDPINRKPIESPVRNKICKHVYDKNSLLQYIGQTRNPRCVIVGCSNRQVIKIDRDIEPDIELKIKIENAKNRNSDDDEDDEED